MYIYTQVIQEAGSTILKVGIEEENDREVPILCTWSLIMQRIIIDS